MTITFEYNVMYIAHFFTSDSGTITHLGERLICLLKIMCHYRLYHTCNLNDTCMSGRPPFSGKNVAYCVSENPLIP